VPRAGAEAFLAEAEAAGMSGHAAFARRMRGFLKFVAGDFADAREDLEQALAAYDERRDESLRAVFALDLRSSALRHLGIVACYLGDLEEAERLTGEAIRRAKDSGQPGSYASALFNHIIIGALCGRAEEVLPVADEVGALAEEHDLKFWRAIASTYSDWARMRLGEPRAEAFHAGLGAFADLGAKLQEAGVLPLLADVELVAGRREEALKSLERGLKLAAETGYGALRPWLLRLRGDALAETDPAGSASASAYRAALRVAGTQGSRALALMAALALAKLLQSTGEAEEAHAILSDMLEGFAPTPLFPAIAEAQALMEHLALGPLGGPGFPLASPALPPTEKEVAVLAPERVERGVIEAGLEQLISPDAAPRLDPRDARKPFSSGGGFSRRESSPFRWRNEDDDKRDAEAAEAERMREEGKTVVKIGWGDPDGRTI
jgi:tetratricopeptide (TPR) repeat protein